MKMTKESLLKVIGAADDVISALAGTNDEVHKDDTDKMVRLWDDLNDQYAPPEVVRELARLALAAMDSEPVALQPELAKVIYHFRDWNEGFPVERFKADYVISWMLANYPPAQPAPERDQVRSAHAEWSQATFGNVGPVGPLKHLSKEALEAAEQPGDLSEWADMQFLLWDAQRRAGITDDQITQAMIEKLAVNKQREWPEPKDGEPRLHIKEQPAPVAQCPYPCGWDALNKLAIQDAAFVSLALVAGEPATESIRSAVISNNDRLLKVISFCRDVMPNAKPVVTQKNCQKCKGTGIADSGGVQPWGEPISIECDCATSQSTAVMDIDELRLAFEAKERESDEGFNLHKYGIGYADDATQARWEQWLACRAAMLNGGKP